MDCVKLPQEFHLMKQPMHPVLSEVRQKHDLEKLRPRGL